MRTNTITDKGLDLIIEVLRQSQAISARIQEEEKKDALDVKENKQLFSSNKARAFTMQPNTDGDILLSRKGHSVGQRKRDESYQTSKGQMEDILNRLTAQDYKRLEEEGFKVEDLTIESLSNAISVIKDYSEGRASTKTKSIKASGSISEENIKDKMEEENLPVTKESLDRVSIALTLSECIPILNKNDLLYLFQRRLSPTIDNLYKARYSSQSNDSPKQLSDSEWKELEGQVKEIIEKAGIIVDNEILQGSKWLIENDIPINIDSINQLIGLEKLTKTYNKDEIFDKVIKGMREGALPGEVALIDRDKLDITYEEQSRDGRGRELTAKRQLEEIRLKMIKEAAIRLEKKGFNIDTQALERIVDKLRLEEEIYYKELYNQTGSQSLEEAIDLLHATTASIDQLKAIPIQVLGRTLNDRSRETVSSLLDKGQALISELEKAKEAYEPLLTRPKAEYGDSIKKAFDNLGSLMEEMNIEDTEYNKRAIRILAYNQMEITKETIEQVKAYDLRVEYLIQNLNPEVTVHIIKEGINPLNMPIDDLNSRIEDLKEQGYSSLDKYSSYLYKLEKDKDISEEERKAYIGIYRLLYQVDKSDGAALGALIKSNQEVTLNHLLTALRTNKKGQMDYKVDKEFGVLDRISSEKESISDQLEAVFNQDSAVQEEIQNSIVKQLIDGLTPEKLQRLQQRMEALDSDSKGEGTRGTDIWDTIGNMPIEQVLEQIKNSDQGSGENQAYYNDKIKELRLIYSNSDQAIRFLNDFKLPNTITNLILAGQILSNKGTGFKKLFGLNASKEEEKEQKSEMHLQKNPELSDTLIDNKIMSEAYEQLEQEVKAVINHESARDQIDHTKLTDLKSMGRQIHFINTLAKKEFYHIPIEANGRITNINLTIIRGKAAGGKVAVTLSSDKLGSIKAEATLKDKVLSGYITCDYIEGLRILESQRAPLESTLQEEDIDVKQLNFCLQQGMDSFSTYQSPQDLEGDNNPENERLLYRIARAMINMIQLAEESVDLYSN